MPTIPSKQGWFYSGKHTFKMDGFEGAPLLDNSSALGKDFGN